MDNPIYQFTQLKKFQQVVFFLSTFEIVMFVFLDYIFLEKLGIDVHAKFLNSWAELLSNLFTIDFFLALFGLVIVYAIYHLTYPLLFLLFQSNLMWSITLLLKVILQFATLLIYLVYKILSGMVFLFAPGKPEGGEKPPPPRTHYETLIWVLSYSSIIQVKENVMTKGKQYKWLLNIYYILKDEAVIVKLMGVCSFFTSLSFIFHYFNHLKLMIVSLVALGIMVVLTYLLSSFYFKALSLVEQVIKIISPDELNRNQQQVS